MSTANEIEKPSYEPYQFKSHARTITETDIVNFVNLVGLHEPYFIDMEFINDNMEGANKSRFAPGPLLISLGMGLVSTQMMAIVDRVLGDHPVGKFAGMTNVDAQIKGSVFVGDTIHVEGEGVIKAVTRSGFTVVNLLHKVMNQHDDLVLEFTETVLFRAP